MADVDATGQRCVKFWIDEAYDSSVEEQAAQHAAEEHDAEWVPQDPPVSVPTFPAFGDRNVESRGPCTPDRREGLTPGYSGQLVLQFTVVLVLAVVLLHCKMFQPAWRG